jgi:hypothetical protein
MLDRLGAWPGGAKPTPFIDGADGGAGSGGRDGSSGGGVSIGGPQVDASGGVLPGDAIVRAFPDAQPPGPDAALARAESGGCDLGGGRPSAMALALMLACLAGGITRCGRRSPPGPGRG